MAVTKETEGRALVLLVASIAAILIAVVLVVRPAPAATLFTNPTPIAIPVTGDASPYPSEIAVSGMSGPITNVAVTLHRVGHTGPDDIDIFLVSPAGDDVMLMSDACGGDDIEDFTWTFSQQAPRAMSNDSSDCGEFAYRPTNHVQGFPGDFDIENTLPQAPYGASLDSFDNENPNGTWKLYVVDDTSSGPGGDIEGGWSLSIETGPVDVAIPASGTSGRAVPYPATRTVSGQTGVITGVNVVLDGIWHQRPDDLDLLLVGPQGEKVILMSDACGTFEVANFGWRWDDEAAAPMPDGDATNRCGTTTYRPTDHEPGDFWPAPAPPGPYETTLSAFDGTDPNGEWSLFVNDDAAGGTGFFTNRFQLQIATDSTVPKVTSVSPANNATGVKPAANVRATFSEVMDDGSINSSTFKLFEAGSTNAVGASVTQGTPLLATLNPDNNLRRGTKYKAVVTTDARDRAGNRLDQKPNVTGNQPKVWFFTTRK